jgi:FkbM family methyltransferase
MLPSLGNNAALSYLARFFYTHRAALQRFVFIRRPILLTLADFKIYVRLDDWAIGARIAVRRTHEPHVTRVIRALLQPGTVMIDIGANIGYYTLLAASRIGSTGKIIAFEPNVANCTLLHKSLQANNFKNVALHNVAVAEAEGVVSLHISDSNGSIVPDHLLAHPYQVRTVILDHVLGDEPRIDLIKMDIEGAEGRALQGMHGVIQRCTPIIVTELHPAALQAVSHITPEEYLNALRALGYVLCVIDRTTGPHTTPQSNTQIMQAWTASKFDQIDLVAYPRHQPRKS